MGNGARTVGSAIIVGRWLICPLCKRKTKIRILPETVLLHFPLYCTHCKKEVVISVVNDNLMIEKTES